MKAYQQNSVLGPGHELSRVREIQVLSNQESRFVLRGFPNLAIRVPNQPLVLDRLNIVAKLFQEVRKPEGKILIQLDLPRICGTSGTGKSSSAEAAAKAMAA